MLGTAFAQSSGAAPPSALMQFLPLVLIFVVFYFLLIRPQQKQQRERQEMINSLRLNEEVSTTGGLLGKVVALTDKIVTLEVAQGVRVRVYRQQINSVEAIDHKPKEKEKDRQK